MTKSEFLASETGLQFAAQMRLAGLRPVTINTYARHISAVSRALAKSPAELTADDPEAYLAHAARKGLSNRNAAISCVALKFYLERTLKLPWRIVQFPRVFKYRARRSRPLARDEITQILRHTRFRRYQLLFALIYGSGLRLGEASRLKISDLDFQNLKVYIRDGKGGRHRETVLPLKLARALQVYLAERRPIYWLFPSNRMSYEAETLFPVLKSTRPISTRSAQREFDVARRHLNLSGLVTIHSLRHSFATHLVEYGMSVFSVQRLLGHQHLVTTLGYLSSMGQPVIADFSPLDRLSDFP